MTSASEVSTIPTRRYSRAGSHIQAPFLLERLELLGSGVLLRALLIAAAVALPAGTLRAELYSWVDDDGVIHLTNIAERVPASYKPYEGEDAEGFGGQKPLVALLPGGNERVLFPVDV